MYPEADGVVDQVGRIRIDEIQRLQCRKQVLGNNDRRAPVDERRGRPFNDLYIKALVPESQCAKAARDRTADYGYTVHWRLPVDRFPR